MNIRKASITDLTAVANVQIASNRTTYKAIMPEEYLINLSIANITENWNERLFVNNSKEFMFIAESDEGTVVGFIAGRIANESNSAIGEITSFYIIEEFQKKGIGKKLLKSAAQLMNEKKLQAVALWTLKQNPSRYFYEHLGGQFAGSRIIDRGGRKLTQVSYLWKDISVLL